MSWRDLAPGLDVSLGLKNTFDTTWWVPGSIEHAQSRLPQEAGKMDIERVDIALGVGDVEAVGSPASAIAAFARSFAVVLVNLADAAPPALVDAAKAAGARWVTTETLPRPWRGQRLRAVLTEPAPSLSMVTAAPAPVSIPASGMHVLVVDDNVINLKVASRMLARCGCRVTTATGGAFALKMLEQDVFDLVMMDRQMPGLDGYTTTRTLRDRERGTGRRTPVVAATANAMRGDRELCLEAGMDDYVSKPLVLEELRRVVNVRARRAPA